jgi:tetratricopeptide (TPR) repeat protein
MSTPEKLMTDIRSMLQEGRYADAAAACREALGEAPDNPDLRMLMGLCDEAAGRPDSARAWMGKALDKNADHPAARYHLGRLLLAAGQDDDARQVLEECVARDPNHAAARTLIARLDHRTGKIDEAVEGLRTALRADEDHAPAYAGLAILLLQQGNVEEAHKHASQAVRLRPADAYSQITMAQVFQAQGHMDFAEQCLRNAIEQQPNHPQLRAALEQIQRVRQPGGDEANTPEALIARMRDHYRVGRVTPAAEIALALQHRIDSDAPELLEVAEVLMDAGQIEASTEMLQRANAGLPRLGLSQARLSAVQGDMEAAFAQLRKLFDSETFRLRHDARRLAADLYLRKNQLADALNTLQPLAEESDLPPATVRMLAQLYHVSGDTAAARKLLENLLAGDKVIEAERAVSHNLLGRILDESGAFEAAARHLSEGGWRAPFMVGELERVSPDGIRQACEALGEWPHSTQAVDDGRPAPVFVTGWPGSGREALLPALANVPGVRVLVPEELTRRRDLLGLPVSPDALSALTDSDLRKVRKRYLQGAVDDQALPLEPGLPEATAWPAVARYFPGARIIRLKAQKPALRLHWRLAGCRELDRMSEVWESEEKLHDQLQSHLPLKVLEVETDVLIDDPGQAAVALAEFLDLENSENLATALSQALKQAGYRKAGHWRHYSEMV